MGGALLSFSSPEFSLRRAHWHNAILEYIESNKGQDLPSYCYQLSNNNKNYFYYYYYYYYYFYHYSYYYYYCYFKTNIQINSNCKAAKYSSLLSELCSSYNTVTFINLSMVAMGVMGSFCTSPFSLLNDLGFDKTIKKRIIIKTMNISIRSRYFIFCQRNKPWTNPELLTI